MADDTTCNYYNSRNEHRRGPTIWSIFHSTRMFAKNWLDKNVFGPWIETQLHFLFRWNKQWHQASDYLHLQKVLSRAGINLTCLEHNFGSVFCFKNRTTWVSKVDSISRLCYFSRQAALAPKGPNNVFRKHNNFGQFTKNGIFKFFLEISHNMWSRSSFKVQQISQLLTTWLNS